MPFTLVFMGHQSKPKTFRPCFHQDVMLATLCILGPSLILQLSLMLSLCTLELKPFINTFPLSLTSSLKVLLTFMLELLCLGGHYCLWSVSHITLPTPHTIRPGSLVGVFWLHFDNPSFFPIFLLKIAQSLKIWS